MKDFINYAGDNFELAVWSSSGSDYAQTIVNYIFDSPNDLKFIWSQEKCVSRMDMESREYYRIKDLKKIKKFGFDLEKVLIIDDSPEKLTRNYGNHIPVIPFKGDPDDDELFKLIKYLEQIKNRYSFRNFDKRNWKTFV